MNDVPLVKDNKINDINTSIIAIKKQLKQLNEAVGLIDIPDMPDLSPYIKKSDVVDAVASGNMNPVTSNAVAQSLNGKKNVQTAVNDPTSDGQQYWDFIRSITQDTNGKIYPVKSHVPYGWTTQAGIVTTYDDPSYDEDRSHVLNRMGFFNANLYSNNEIYTGKTWINGKPIFRKVISGLSQSGHNTWIYVTTITNIENIIDLNCIGIGNNNHTNFLSPISEIYSSNGDIYVYIANYSYTVNTAIIEYTKV